MIEELKYQLGNFFSKIKDFPIIGTILSLIWWWIMKCVSLFKKSKIKFVGFLAITYLVFLMIPFTFGLVYETGLYALTSKTEVLYLNDAEEFEPNKYNVRGCQDINCNVDNTVYFRIEQSPFSMVYSLLTSGSQFYPDYLGAAVAPGINECTVKSYGFRFKFLISKNIYPNILELNCEYKRNE